MKKEGSKSLFFGKEDYKSKSIHIDKSVRTYHSPGDARQCKAVSCCYDKAADSLTPMFSQNSTMHEFQGTACIHIE